MLKSDAFLVFSLFYLGGIFFASFFIAGNYNEWAMVMAMISIASLGIFWGKKKIAVFSFSLLFGSFGCFYYGNNISKIFDSSISDLDGSLLEASGLVVKDFQAADNKRIIVALENVYQEGKKKPVSLRAIVYLDKYDQIEAGDRIRISGIAEKPANFSNFDYIGYLAKEDIFITIKKAKASVVEKNGLSYFEKKILDLKNSISSSISSSFIPSQAPVVQAMVLGESEKMTKEYKEKLSRTGLSHAIAISGSHFALIAIILFNLFLLLGFWKNQSLVLVLVSLVLYIILIYFPASAVRAGIMIGFVYLARIAGRQSQEWRLLIFAAFLMNLENPLVLKHDLGFQLSFLAVAGLIYLAPIIDNYLDRIFRNRAIWLKNILSATLAAQIAVTPFLLSATQGFSLSGIFTNILIVPVMPFCLGLGFLYSFVSFIPFLGKVIAFISFPLIEYLNIVIDIFSSLPFSYFYLAIPAYVTLIIYIILTMLVIRGRERHLFKIYNY